MTNAGNDNRLRGALEAYGADPARWPDALRGGLRAALRADPRLAEAAAREAALDRMLEADRADGPLPEGLRARLLHAAPRSAPAGRLVWPGWAQAAATAATLVFGVVAGFAGAAAALPGASPEQALLEVALTDPSVDYETILEDGA